MCIRDSAYSMKIFHGFNGYEFQSITSITDTDVVLSYDADWGNAKSHAPFTYDYFSETLRDRETFSQELRLVSDELDFNSNRSTVWVLGISYFDVKEVNFKNDDGVYGDPSDPFGPYGSKSSSSSHFSSDNLSIFGNIDYFLDEFIKPVSYTHLTLPTKA